jgi:hypothetical protein
MLTKEAPAAGVSNQKKGGNMEGEKRTYTDVFLTHDFTTQCFQLEWMEN